MFLYSLYLKRSEKIEVLVGQTIETSLTKDGIVYPELFNVPEEVPYISAQSHKFKKDELASVSSTNMILPSVDDTNIIRVRLAKPVKITTMSNNFFKEFLDKNIYKASEYVLWEIDEDKQQAVYYQLVRKQIVFNDVKASVTVHWNEDKEIVSYEQGLIESPKNYKQSDKILPQLQILQVLYNKGYLPAGSEVTKMSIGYSSPINLSEKPVYLPTWLIHITDTNGQEKEYFFEAVKGDMINLEDIDDDEEREHEDMSEKSDTNRNTVAE